MQHRESRTSRSLRRWLTARELIVRSNGRQRLFTITPAMQIGALGLLLLALFVTIAAVNSISHGLRQTASMHDALTERAAAVSDEQLRIAVYRDELDAARLQLERRQAFIERMVEMLPAADEEEGNALATSSGEASPQESSRLDRIGALLPAARGLADLERRQLAAVAALTTYGENRAARAERGIRRLGLDPRPLLLATRGTLESEALETGMGGPLEPLATEADGSLHPSFERLGSVLARMVALEQGLAWVPQVMPADGARMTSRYGYRRDPFTGQGAMHSGLDFGGRTGDPIRSAAAGTVSFAGTNGGYGKMIDIDHGNGLTTRYAHMSAFRAQVGQTVEAGELIGAIGSTGRSTGPHLHFEVRVRGQAVNPRPLLEDARHVLEEVRSEFLPERAAGGGY